MTYSYDDTDQLTGVTGARSESFGYDSGGKRNTTGYSTGTGNRLTASPGYTYNSEGNLSSKTQTSTGDTFDYTWDYHNSLTGVTKKNSSQAVTMQAT